MSICSKTFFSIVFKSNGPLLIHHIERGQTIGHQYYINNCLRPLIDEIKRQRPAYGTRVIQIHFDNGRLHAHENVTLYLQSKDLTIIPHAPYSPDLSPCDLWLFDLIKENLADQNGSVSLHDAVTDFIYSLNQEEYRKTFEKWVERMELCIENQSDYFEHLMK